MALADHLVVMNDGRIEDEGTPEWIYARPASRFVARFMGESTVIGDVAVRPEHLHLAKGEGLVFLGAARVTAVVFQGSFKRVLARGDKGEEFIARVAADVEVTVGDLVMPSARAEHMIRLVK